MIVFFFLSLSLRFGAWYARLSIVSSGVLAAITLVIAIKECRNKGDQPGHVKLAELTDEEKEALSTAEQVSAMEIDEETTPFFSKDVLLVMIVSFVTALLWKSLSFLIAGFLSLLILFLCKKQPLVKSVIVAAVTVVVIQYVFGNLFQIPLPTPSWWSIY